MREIYAELAREMKQYEDEWKVIASADLAVLDQKARDLGTSYVILPEAAGKP
jgi:hypothetical protein